MRLLPMFTFYDINTAGNHILTLIEHIQEQGSAIRLGIRAPIALLESLDDSLKQQIAPFISSGRINIFPDSSDAAFQGLMNVRNLREYLKKGLTAFTAHYPELSPVFIPRWHDYQREEARNMYRSILPAVIIPLRAVWKGSYYRIMTKDAGDQIIPVIFPDNSSARHFASGLRMKIEKSRHEVLQLMNREIFQKEDNWDTIIMVNGDKEHKRILEAFLALSKKKHELICGRGEIRPLHAAGNSEEELSVDWPEFDPPYFGPEFISQFLSKPGKKPSRKASFSSIFPLPHPDHTEEPRFWRTITLSLLGDVELREQDFTVFFTQGNIDRMVYNGGTFVFPGGISSLFLLRRGKIGRKHAFKIENAVAVEDGGIRGLRQILSLEVPGTKISGRISNDFLLVNNNRELYLDTYIQHPWIVEDHTVLRYIPQMLVLWDEVSMRRTLTLRSRNHDGTERNLRVDLSKTGRRSCIFLPGSAWILGCGQSRIGIDLVHGRKLKLHLPSAVLVEKIKQNNYRVSFLPMAEYINPDVSIMNGLMEHYTLCFKPDIDTFENLGTIKKDVIDNMNEPSIVYF